MQQARMTRITTATFAAVLASGLLSLASRPASAAILTGTVGTPASPENLTTDGPIDWAIWDDQSSTAGTNGQSSNRKSGGSAIGAATAVLGTPRGITGTVPNPTYTYTNGTSPTSQTNSLIGALTDTSINTTGSGVQVTLTGNPSAPEVAKIFVTGFDAVGTLTATLDGQTYTDSTGNFAGTRTPLLYTLTFQPNAAGDLLTVKYVISSLNSGGNSNVDLQAVAVATPEPNSLALMALGAVGLLARRRKDRLRRGT